MCIYIFIRENGNKHHYKLQIYLDKLIYFRKYIILYFILINVSIINIVLFINYY